MTVTAMPESVTRRLVARVARGVGILRRRPRAGLRVLMYHAVAAAASDHYGVTTERFAAHVEWLVKDSGLAVVDLEGAVGRVSAPTGDTTVALTFDDGYLDVLTVAAPLLARYRVPFTVFVIGDFLRRPPRPGVYLDVAALRDLAAVPGVTIGAHGATHRPLTRLDDVALAEDLRRSADALGDAIGRRPVAMSYPHGAVDERVVRCAAATGFRLAGTSLFGVNGPGIPPLRLRRTEISGFDDVGALMRKVRGDYDWYRIKQRLYWPLPTV